MQVEQLSVKLFARPNPAFAPGGLIPVFHRWIREGRVLQHRLPIDVADYRHVAHGPGVMVICNGCHFGVEEEGGRGLLYSRKRDSAGPAAEKLREALKDALTVATALEAENVGLGFDPERAEVRIMSRRLARNTPSTFETFAPILSSVVTELYGSQPTELEQLVGSEEPFGVGFRVVGHSDLRSVLGRAAS